MIIITLIKAFKKVAMWIATKVAPLKAVTAIVATTTAAAIVLIVVA